MRCAKAEMVCLVCLRVADHKKENCTNKIKECLICKKLHHVNLHKRDDVITAFKKLKEQKASQDQQ